MNRGFGVASTIGLITLLAVAVARGDEKQPERTDFPIDIRGSLKTGDWATYTQSLEVDGVRTEEPITYRVTAPIPDGDNVWTMVCGWGPVTRRCLTFKTKSLPSVEAIAGFRPVQGAEVVKKVRDEKRTVGKTELACKRVTLSFVSTTAVVVQGQLDVWFSKDVKATSIVAYRMEHELKPASGKASRAVLEATLVGYGSKDKVEWGTAAPADDFDPKKIGLGHAATPLPLDPFAKAAKGDWASYSGTNPGTFTIGALEGDTVTLETPDGERKLSVKDPEIVTFFNMSVFKDGDVGLKVEDARRKVGSKEFAGKKVTFVSSDWTREICQLRTLVFWVSPDVKCGGVVAAQRVDVDAVLDKKMARQSYDCELTGYGTASETLWGERRSK
jgi:hypothetical protein